MSRRAHFARGIGLCGVLSFAGCGDPPAAGPEGARPDPPAEQISAESIDAALQAAEQYVVEDDYRSAEAVADRLIEQVPREPRARELQARILLGRALQARERGSPQTSELLRRSYEQYREAVALSPSSGLHQSAGTVASMAGDSEAALEHYRQAAALDPLNPQHPLYAAQLLIAAGHHEEAGRLLREVLILDPDEPLAYASLAGLALEQGDYDGALGQNRRARELDRDRLDFRVQEARILRRRGEPARSLERLVTLRPDERATLLVAEEIAAAYTALEAHEKAAEAWAHRHRHSGDPESWRAAVSAAEAMLRAGRRQMARSWLAEARLVAPRSPEVLALESELAGED